MIEQKKPRAALLSLPWADCHSPSIQIGCLASYARRAGFDVDAVHLHLNATATMGINEYMLIVAHPPFGEVLCAALVYPRYADRILNSLEYAPFDVRSYFENIQGVLDNTIGDIDWSPYDIVGFTITNQQFFSSLYVSRLIKKNYPAVKIVFGGRCVAGVLGRSVLENFPEVDWCIDGEGEFAFVELLRCIKAGKQRPERCVPGLIYRSAKAIRTTERRQLQNLAGMPDPDFEQYYSAAEELRKRYHIDVKPILPVEESRGCIYRCAFCSHWRYFDGHRLRPARDVADSIRRQSRRYGINSVALVSSLIITGGRQKLFRMIASQKKDYSMFCEVRADISREELALMKSAGVMRVQAGVEALDTALLKKMQKGTSVIENLSVMKHCEELGIYM